MSDQDDEQTIVDDAVVNKYKMAGDIVNSVAQKIIDGCVEGASVCSLCQMGDKLMKEGTTELFKTDKKPPPHGIAFPLCISVNNCINHYSPLVSDKDTELKDGDVVKLDLGAHIDEFISVLGHTIVVGASKENKVVGRKADVILAAHHGMEAALNLLKDGNQNYTVTDAIGKVADCYKCKPIEGMCSFQLHQGRIEGDKVIVQNPTDAHRKEVEKIEFKNYEVYAIDVVISTGVGKGKELESRITIYRKGEDVYNLKLKTSREFYSKVKKNFSTMPFNLRHFDDEKKARMGVVECSNHRLIDPYPVLYDKAGEFVAQFKSTVLLLPKEITRVSHLPIDITMFESEHSIEDLDLKELVISSLPVAKPKKKKIKKGKGPEGKVKESKKKRKVSEEQEEDSDEIEESEEKVEDSEQKQTVSS